MKAHDKMKKQIMIFTLLFSLVACMNQVSDSSPQSSLHIDNLDISKYGGGTKERSLVVCNIKDKNDVLNVRDEPNVNGRVVDRLKNGDVVTLYNDFDKYRTKNWRLIRGRSTGWASKKYLCKAPLGAESIL